MKQNIYLSIGIFILIVLAIFSFGSNITGWTIYDIIIEDDTLREFVQYESVIVSDDIYGVQFKGVFIGENFEVFVMGENPERIYALSNNDYVNFIYDLRDKKGEVIFMFKYSGEFRNPSKRLIDAEQSVIMSLI